VQYLAIALQYVIVSAHPLSADVEADVSETAAVGGFGSLPHSPHVAWQTVLNDLLSQ